MHQFDELADGVAYCQLLDAVEPRISILKRLKFDKRMSKTQCMHNLRQFVKACNYIGISPPRDMSVERLADGIAHDHYEMLSWCHTTITTLYPHVFLGYDGVQRRVEAFEPSVHDRSHLFSPRVSLRSTTPQQVAPVDQYQPTLQQLPENTSVDVSQDFSLMGVSSEYLHNSFEQPASSATAAHSRFRVPSDSRTTDRSVEEKAQTIAKQLTRFRALQRDILLAKRQRDTLFEALRNIENALIFIPESSGQLREDVRAILTRCST